MNHFIRTEPMQDYLALPALSGGLVDTILRQSPAHARYQQEHSGSDFCNTADVGTAIHDAFLEGIDRIEAIDPEKYPSKDGKTPKGWTNNAIRQARDLARASGRIPLLIHDVAQVKAAVDALYAFVATTEIAGFKGEGKPEQTVTWEDGGVLCKARPDWLSPKWHVSLKTTDGIANPATWIRRQMSEMGYDRSLVFYERGFRFHKLTVESRILIVEQNPPYGCALVGLAPSRREYVERCVESAIRVWGECEFNGVWPGYVTQTHFAEIQPWELSEIESTL
jgi:hypothetical protein